MLWALPLAGAALGMLNAGEQQKKEEANNHMQAEIEKYSPWTHMHGKVSHEAPSMLGGAMQGGMAGLSLGQQFGGAKPPQGAEMAPPEAAPSSAIGAPNYSQQMAQDYGPSSFNFQQAPNFYASK